MFARWVCVNNEHSDLFDFNFGLNNTRKNKWCDAPEQWLLAYSWQVPWVATLLFASTCFTFKFNVHLFFTSAAKVNREKKCEKASDDALINVRIGIGPFFILFISWINRLTLFARAFVRLDDACFNVIIFRCFIKWICWRRCDKCASL